MNVLKLKAKIIECGISIDELSAILGIDQSTFYRRLSGEKFTVGDVRKISLALKLKHEDIMSIFFANVVA